jgi:predicted metal-binding membrane protein
VTMSAVSAAPAAPAGGLWGAVRARLGLVALLFALAALAWWSTADRMADMDAGPGTDLGTLGWFVGIWVVMMAAMMFPSVSPTVALYARMRRGRDAVAPLLFAAGYLAVWSAAGAAAYGVFRAGRELLGGQLAWDAGGRWLAGGILIAAAIYELTPSKDLCLSKCRSPLGYLMGSWRDGRVGALRMGAGHGAWCLGCCWALMAALFALGVMSIAWTAIVAGAIAIQKTLPYRRVAVWGVTAFLLALAIGVLAFPGDVPGLTVPGGSDAMKATDSMRMP